MSRTRQGEKHYWFEDDYNVAGDFQASDLLKEWASKPLGIESPNLLTLESSDFFFFF